MSGVFHINEQHYVNDEMKENLHCRCPSKPSSTTFIIRNIKVWVNILIVGSVVHPVSLYSSLENLNCYGVLHTGRKHVVGLDGGRTKHRPVWLCLVNKTLWLGKDFGLVKF